MTENIERECLYCGMLQPVPVADFGESPGGTRCIKCDDPLYGQGDGSRITVDIAHHNETVAQALDKMERVLNDAWLDHVSSVRLIVGGGAIHDAVVGELLFQHRAGRLLAYREEAPNRGAVLVHLRGER
ncbi:MAG: hypothetical protein ACQETO_01435 [Pseudomonadota bacterium]